MATGDLKRGYQKRENPYFKINYFSELVIESVDIVEMVTVIGGFGTDKYIMMFQNFVER